MNGPEIGCHDQRRRQLIRDRKLNGIDSVDVAGTHLCVHFLTGLPDAFLPKKGAGGARDWKTAAMAHIVIAGGRRITGIRVLDLDPDEAPSKFDESCLGIELDKEGDWSTYTICFVETADGRPTDVPLKSLDPRYACATFTFKSDCPAEIDCRAGRDVCAAAAGAAGLFVSRQGLRDVPAADSRPSRADDAQMARAPRSRPRPDARRDPRLRRRLSELLPGCGRHRAVPRHRAAADFRQAARSAGRLRDARRLQRPRVRAAAGGW